MDLRGLEAMIAVERTGNFTKAANKLNLSQPALSRRVAVQPPPAARSAAGR